MYSRRRRDAGERLERERAELEAVGRLVGRRARACPGASSSSSSGARAEDADVRAVPLVGGAGERVGAERREVERARCGAAATASIEMRAPTACAAATIAVSSGTVPTAFDAAVTATQRVRSREHGLDGRRGQLERARGPARPSARSRRRARPRSPTGRTFASWSRRVHDDLVARPERAPDGGAKPHRHRGHLRAEGDAARVGAEQPARPRRARRSTHSSVACAAANTPPWLALRAGAHPLVHRLDRAVDHLRPGRARRGAPSPRRAPGKRSRFTALAPPRAPARASCGRSSAARRGLGDVHPAHLVDLVVRHESRARPPAPSASSGRPSRGPCCRGSDVGGSSSPSPQRSPISSSTSRSAACSHVSPGSSLPFGKRPVVVARPVHDRRARRAAGARRHTTPPTP